MGYRECQTYMREILDDFLPPVGTPLPHELLSALRTLLNHTDGAPSSLIAALSQCLDLCPGYTFAATTSACNCESNSGLTSTADHTTSHGMYFANYAPNITAEMENVEILPHTDWTSIEILIEFTSDDGGLDGKVAGGGGSSSNSDGDSDSESRGKPLIEILSGAQRIITRQHRIFSFVVLLIDDYARILRCDHAGFVATDRIYYQTSPELCLLEFFWRCSRLSSEHRGADPTAERVPLDSPYADVMRARAASGIKDYARDYFEASLDEAWPWWLLSLRDKETGEDRKFLVGAPHTRGLDDLASLGTRGYCHGVPPAASYAIKDLQHYRLVVKEVGKNLENFKDGYELLLALYFCVLAHRDAYNVGIVHRDLSAGNILLYPDEDGDMAGMLTGWELSKALNNKSPTCRQPERTGIWQSMSAQALNDPEKVVVLADELKSVFHVLLYMAIRFLPHNCHPEFVGKLLYDYFDSYQETDQGYRCGDKKMAATREGKITFPQRGKTVNLGFSFAQGDPTEHPINGVVYELLRWFRAYYAVHCPEVRSTKESTPARPIGAIKQISVARYLKAAERRDDPVQDPLKAAVYANPDASEPGQVGVSQQGTMALGAPTAEDRALAEKLTSHTAMILLFDEWLAPGRRWPDEEEEEDKRPEGG